MLISCSQSCCPVIEVMPDVMAVVIIEVVYGTGADVLADVNVHVLVAIMAALELVLTA